MLINNFSTLLQDGASYTNMTQLISFGWLKHVADVIFIFLAIWGLFAVLFYNKRSRTQAKGFIIIAIIVALSRLIELPIFDHMVEYFIPTIGLAGIVIFQPEIRYTLNKMGKRLSLNERVVQVDKKIDVVTELYEVIKYFSKRKIGALITIRNKDSLEEFISRETAIEGLVSSELLKTIFMYNSPLHDGGVIIDGTRIIYAGAMYPMSVNDELTKELGSRHRAAIGLAETTDAITIVVSEQTGEVSVTHKGILDRNISWDMLHYYLEMNTK